MVEQRTQRLNKLENELPEGLVVDAAWLTKHGIPSNLRVHYVKKGWLDQPAGRVFRRPRGSLSWQQVVISLQTLLLRNPLMVGGRTALELQGFAHYLSRTETEVHLYGPKPPPTWLSKLPLKVRFAYHNNKKLFRNEPVTFGATSLNWDVAKNQTSDSNPSYTVQPWGQWDWPLTLSTPERAILELLDELPERESFHQVDMLFEGLTNLRPQRTQKLLVDCKNVKVKRLFFFFADRHKHAWLKRLDKSVVDLGKGNRMLVKAGKLDRTYHITVPEDFNGVQ